MTTLRLPFSLRLKSRLVGTRLEPAAKSVRWVLGAIHRFRHPELWEMHLEEQRLPLVLQRLLKANSSGVDVGGHLGSFLSLLIQFAPGGRHIAFEASPSKAALLKSRFPRTEVLPYAAAETAGVAFFHENAERSGYSRIEETANSAVRHIASYEVTTCRLDDILYDREKIDLIKLDIEGGELAAIRGAKRTIKKFRPSIIFECGTEYALAEFKISRRELFDYVTLDIGYEIFCFGDFLFNKGPMEFEEFSKCGLYPFRALNFLALPRLSPPATPKLMVR